MNTDGAGGRSGDEHGEDPTARRAVMEALQETPQISTSAPAVAACGGAGEAGGSSSTRKRPVDMDNIVDLGYDPEDTDSEIEYEPGELVDRNNKESYMRYMVQKLQNGELTIFTPRAFKCPFDDKPDDGLRAALLTHARSLSRVGKTEQIQASHKALLLYMAGDADPDLPGINSARHQRRKMARKVKKDRKLDLEYGGKQQ